MPLVAAARLAGSVRALAGLHRLSLREPTNQLGIQITQRPEDHVVADAMRSHPLGTTDPLITDLMIRDEADAEVIAPNRDAAEVVLADEING